MSRYHANLKVQARDPKKIYGIDTGLRTVSLVSERTDWGRIAENVVYIELRRRGKELYYFKESKEVDFVVTELGKPVEVIQVAYSDLENPKTKEREVSALLECMQCLRRLDKITFKYVGFEDGWYNSILRENQKERC